MIRTRDFMLFVLSAGFLLVAITTTVATSRDATPGPSPFAEVPEANYEAEVPTEELDRAGQLSRLREKIAAQEGQSIASVYDETVEATSEPTSIEPTATATPTVRTEVQLCDDYTPAVVSWPATGVQTAEREGARIVYTTQSEPTSPLLGSSTDMGEAETENILLQLPMRTRPLPSSSCIPTDVVGVALDGSLIRNSDHTLYGIFGPETRVGYALDGFPIYGTANEEIELDECGGAMVGSGYRYYLHPDRPGVLGCFAGVPVSL